MENLMGKCIERESNNSKTSDYLVIHSHSDSCFCFGWAQKDSASHWPNLSERDARFYIDLGPISEAHLTNVLGITFPDLQTCSNPAENKGR